MTIQVDPEFRAHIPALREDERVGLEASLIAEGCRDPLVTWNGLLLDGHNRFEICERNGIEYRTVQLDLENRTAALAWIEDNQLNRRNLTADQVRYYRGRQYNREKKSKAEAGAIGGASKDQIDTCLPSTADRLATEHGVGSATIKRDGKFAEEIEATPELHAAVMKGASTAKIKNEKKKQKKREREQEIAELAATCDTARAEYDLRNESFMHALALPGEQCDWVITDPPYPKEFLHLYNGLGQAAEHLLKPGGSLLCMIGQSYLPDIVQSLSRHLNYHWTLAYLTPGGQATQLFPRRVNTFWKPVLWFVKGEFNGAWIGDVTRSNVNDNDKSRHDWGQSESGMADLMGRFVKPGDRVCDPFMGAGTTGVVALDLGATFLGFDDDIRAYNEAVVRLDRASLVA